MWADSSEATARKNLRDALYNIRKVLGQDILIIEGNSRIALNREQDICIDVEQDTRANLLERVKGEFLQFFYVKTVMNLKIGQRARDLDADGII